MNLAMLGYGTVGKGVSSLIDKNKNKLSDKGVEIRLCKILTKDLNKHSNSEHFNIITDDIVNIFNSNPQIIIEVMGGLHPAYEYVKEALKRGIHVVTANKDLIAEFGDELLNLAKDNGVLLKFEASVAGGIPIIKPLSECLLGNEILSIKGILNGTTNFILSKMNNENMSYEEALKIAQNLGFAEVNPESDVMGYDTARKLSILSTIGFGKRIYWKDMKIEGITELDSLDFDYAKKNKNTIKLLAIAEYLKDGIYASVMPVMVDNNSVLAKIDNEFNIVTIEGDTAGELVFTGKGAGMYPTANSVFSDIVDIAIHRGYSVTFSNSRATLDTLLSTEKTWYVRVKTNNRTYAMGLLSHYSQKCFLPLDQSLVDNSEIVAFVKVKSEDILNKALSEIENSSEYFKAKKILMLNGRMF